VRLLLVRPGFVVGRMTEGMSPAPFSSTPEQVAQATVRALRSGRGEVWVPSVLRPVFGVMRLLPRAIWRRMPR
jgi:short-subunit dehydrogenase